MFPPIRFSSARLAPFLRAALGLSAAAALAAVVGCSSQPKVPTPIPEPAPPGVVPPQPLPSVEALRLTGRGRWVRGDWADLPGWGADPIEPAWSALLRSCERQLRVLIGGNGAAPIGSPAASQTFPPLQVAATWGPTCRAAIALGGGADARQIRSFLQNRLLPWRVETPQGHADGLLTGYFEPLLEASRQRSERFHVPLYAVPADLATRRPWYTRAQIDGSPAVQALLAGREIAWVADPMDALLLHIQGSGRLTLTEPNGLRRTVRVAYAAHNDQPYQSVGRWLVEQGAFTLEQANWPAIRAWARANPQRVREMLAVNPRYVFFREEALPDPTLGALGAQGVPLTPGHSIAVDRESIPYGTPVWLASTEPQPWQPIAPPARPMQRLVLAQDTGSAITGAVRADLFWGWGEGIEDRAGRTKQPLRLWVLWPR